MIKNKKIILVFLVFFIALCGSVFWYFNKYDTPDYEHIGFFPTTKLKPEWERKIDTEQVLKIGVITDTHVRPSRVDKTNKFNDAERALFSEDLTSLQKFNARMKEFSPEMIVHLGDVIEGTGDEDFIGIMGIKLVRGELQKSGVPIYWALGNHELRSVTKEQYKKTLEIDNLDYFIDNGDYRLIFLDANYTKNNDEIAPGKNYVAGHLHPDTLSWLEEKLKTNKRVFIFMHQAAFDRVLKGESKYLKESIDNANDIRVLMEKYNVDAIFNGHIEVRLHEEVNGVKYFPLIGAEKSNIHSQAYHAITIYGGEPIVETYYTDKESGEEKSL